MLSCSLDEGLMCYLNSNKLPGPPDNLKQNQSSVSSIILKYQECQLRGIWKSREGEPRTDPRTKKMGNQCKENRRKESKERIRQPFKEKLPRRVLSMSCRWE